MKEYTCFLCGNVIPETHFYITEKTEEVCDDCHKIIDAICTENLHGRNGEQVHFMAFSKAVLHHFSPVLSCSHCRRPVVGAFYRGVLIWRYLCDDCRDELDKQLEEAAPTVKDFL